MVFGTPPRGLFPLLQLQHLSHSSLCSGPRLPPLHSCCDPQRSSHGTGISTMLVALATTGLYRHQQLLLVPTGNSDLPHSVKPQICFMTPSILLQRRLHLHLVTLFQESQIWHECQSFYEPFMPFKPVPSQIISSSGARTSTVLAALDHRCCALTLKKYFPQYLTPVMMISS